MRGYKLTSQKKIQMLILTQTHMQKRVFFLDFYIKKVIIIIIIFFASRQQKNLFSLAAMVAVQRRKHSQTWQGREPVSPSGPNFLRTPSWRWAHAPRRLRKHHQPLSRRCRGRHGGALRCVSRKRVMVPMFWRHYRWQLHPWKVLAPQFHYLWSACTTFPWFCAFTLQKMT